MQTRNVLHDIEQRFEDLRRELLGAWGEGRLEEPRVPACDLTEEPDAYTLTVELPGIDKKDVTLEVDERGAHVRAEHKEESKVERKGYVRQERRARSFERYVRFPEEVAPDGVRATFRNGVLDVHAPKAAPEARAARRVDIA